jgi:ABC-type multidrug transport system fused ATPase/permease subunit
MGRTIYITNTGDDKNDGFVTPHRHAYRGSRAKENPQRNFQKGSETEALEESDVASFISTPERLTPSHAVKKGTRYRYYVSRPLIVGTAKDHSKGRRHTLWWLWLGSGGSCRMVSIFVLAPMSLYLNWRLGMLLIGLCVVFVVLTAWVLRRTESLQKSVERYYSDLAERASDTLGNVALVQSFTRVEAEVRDLRNVIDRLLGAQIPVLSWWALAKD